MSFRIRSTRKNNKTKWEAWRREGGICFEIDWHADFIAPFLFEWVWVGVKKRSSNLNKKAVWVEAATRLYFSINNCFKIQIVITVTSLEN